MEGSWRAIAVALGVFGAASAAHAQTANSSPVPPAECHAHVGYDRDADFPGYLLPTKLGPKTCIPFAATEAHPPAGYKGDFYVDEFTDAKITARWEACKADPACRAPIDKHAAARKPPNREHDITDPHTLWLLGRPPAGEPVDLRDIRRPGFFGKGADPEVIAAAEPHTYTVEFTAPAEPYERLALHSDKPVKLRGWYLRGQGVPDGHGHRKRSLILFSGGGGARLVAIEDSHDVLYHMVDGRSVLQRFPTANSGASGVRYWRDMMFALNKAGFDVLSYDRRGVGISTGFSDTNTLQQGRDILGVVGALRTGEGLRVLTPQGKTLAGRAGAQALLGPVAGDQLPILLGGNSRGTMATGWAMARNFDRTCDYDLGPTPECGPPVGYRNMKGAIQLADYTAGPGYQIAFSNQDDQERQLFMGATVEKYHIVFFPSSAILASVPKWPALFIGRGLFDYAESLEGATEAVRREPGLKELVVVRGPHPFEVWPAPERKRVIGRIIAFATAATFDRKTAPGARPWHDMKELVATTDDYWEPSSAPKAATP
jgi:pimeloyl-ACP methyl ester carboxylesterase